MKNSLKFTALLFSLSLLSACAQDLAEVAASSSCQSLSGNLTSLEFSNGSGDSLQLDLVQKSANVAGPVYGACSGGAVTDTQINYIKSALNNASYCGTTKNSGSGLQVNSSTGSLNAYQPSNSTTRLNGVSWDQFSAKLKEYAQAISSSCSGSGGLPEIPTF